MAKTTNPLQLEAIAHIRTPYPEKFSVPRQPGLVDAACRIEFTDAYQDRNMLRGLAQFSHLWLVFGFHQNHGWQPLVRPPRLGGNEKVGVFASRSSFRPNGLGMSVVRLGSTSLSGTMAIEVFAADLVDGTPIYDIKPYIPYADAISDAEGGYAQQAPSTLPVTISAAAEQQLQTLKRRYPNLRQLICQVLSQDPRPAYHQENALTRSYGTALYDINVRWRVIDHVVEVEEIEPIAAKGF